MATIEELLEELRRNPRHVRFHDADRVCRAYFGENARFASCVQNALARQSAHQYPKS